MNRLLGRVLLKSISVLQLTEWDEIQNCSYFGPLHCPSHHIQLSIFWQPIRAINFQMNYCESQLRVGKNWYFMSNLMGIEGVFLINREEGVRSNKTYFYIKCDDFKVAGIVRDEMWTQNGWKRFPTILHRPANVAASFRVNWCRFNDWIIASEFRLMEQMPQSGPVAIQFKPHPPRWHSSMLQ